MKRQSINKKNKKDWIKAALSALILIIIINVFVLQTVTVTDSKMESTLNPGDFVLINKLGTGARVPVTLLSMPLLGNNFPFTNVRTYTELIQLPYLRLPGLSSIKYNEIIAFNYPVERDLPTDKKTIMIKRVIGLPCDTVAISDKRIFINGNTLNNCKSCKYRYRLSAVNKLTHDFFSAYGINEGKPVAEPYIYDVYITKEQSKALAADSLIRSANLIKLRRDIKYTPFFPQSKYYNWSLDYFGPIVIPGKGLTIKLNARLLDLYRKVIEQYENNAVYTRNDSVFINNRFSDEYTFKMNYYFVLDDNRDNGKDSRYWGFLPESHIIGKASIIWFSFDNTNGSFNVRWNRLFKSI